MSKYRLQTGNLNISCSWWEEMLLSYHMDSSEAIITSNASVVFYFSYIAPWNSTKNSFNEISPTHYFPLFPSASRFLSSLSESDVSVIIMNHAPSHIFLLCLHHSAVLRTEHFLQKTLSLFLQDLFWCSSMNVAQVLRAEYYDQKVRIY